MTTTARERLAALLGEATASGASSARRTAPVDDLQLEVRGLGPLRLPVPHAQAEQLCRLGRPARYGRGEQTLLDRRVRDTWEIPKSRVKIDKRRWNRTLLPVLDRLRADLGLPPSCTLKAELHSMLVYGPGQFFLPHQDSEKADAMVGSLVVTLPASFKGGALVVEHRGEARTYRSSRTSLAFVAFYSDCLHEIRPVTSGYRIALTYNLLLRGDPAATATTDLAPEFVDTLTRCLEEHFTTPVASPPWSAAPSSAPPDRLVYLLDHEYTARGLGWSRLKGGDARGAAALRAVAERADCDVVLALADVHETWSCFGHDEYEYGYGGGYGRRGYGRWGDWDDEPGDDEEAWSDGATEPDDYELEELADWDITLERWIDPSGAEPEPIATSVADSEVCATTPSVALRPYASEYEGYMGNYGNTMDRWYRRAAVVLWPRRRAFAVRAEASPAWAIDALWTRLRAGEVAEAQAMAATLEPIWTRMAGFEPQRRSVTKALRVARALDQPALAAMLLEPFRVEMLARSHARPLVALVDNYGEPWAREMLDAWSRRRQRWWSPGDRDRSAWIASLGQLCEALHAVDGTGTATARMLVQEAWAWTRAEIEQRGKLVAPSRREQALGELARPILGLLEATAVVAAADLRDELVGFLHAEGDRMLACLMQVLRAGTALPDATRTAGGLDLVAQHCAERLRQRLARPRRADDDWSVELPDGCSCELCDTLGGFLTDGSRRTFEWPIAKQRRRHVHGRLDAAELPVGHQTRRTGRPYTLVLTKTEAIFEREHEARRRDEEGLAWLDVHLAGPP